MQNFTIKSSQINYCVEYYVELLGVLSILCADQDAVCEAGILRCNEAYVDEVKSFFADTAYRPLCEMLERFSDEYNFNYDAPVTLMLLVSNGAEIDREALFKDRKPIPDELFDAFLAELKAFEAESNFAAFYDSHIPMYREIAEHFITDYEKYNSHRWLTDFLGRGMDCEYYVNFMLGVTNANYGAAVGNRVYANLRPFFRSRYAPLPDYSYSPIYFSTLILHEFAHSFINPVIAGYSAEIRAIDPEKYAGALDEFCYGDSVETLISETVIRAMECLYVKETFPTVYGDYADEYIDEGYTKLNEVIAVLETGPDFGRIIEIFREN